MAPTNSKTVHQTSFTPYREQPRSTRIVVAYPRPAFSATNRTNTFQPVLINNSKFLKATHRTKIRKIEIPRSMVVEALSCWSRRASQHPAVTKPCASLKKPHESCPFAAPCGPRRKKNDRGQRSAFPSETSRFALSILAHRGSALPWLVNDRAALRLRRIWCCVTPAGTSNELDVQNKWKKTHIQILSTYIKLVIRRTDTRLQSLQFSN